MTQRIIPIDEALGSGEVHPMLLRDQAPIPTFKPAAKQAAPESNRHGIPLRGDDPLKCSYPRCPRPVTTYVDMRICNSHVHQVVDEVKRREPERFVVVRTVRPKVEEKPKRNLPKDGTIYYLEHDGHIKIGWTSDLRRRMRQFPPGAALLATEPGTQSDERKVHRKFKVHRTHGNEWFAAVPSLKHHVEMVKRRYGTPPDDVIVGASPVTIAETRAKEFTAVKARSGYRRGSRNWGFTTGQR